MRNWHSVAREPPLSADSSSLSFPHCSLLTQRRLLRVGATFLATTAHYEGDRLAPSGGVEMHIDAIASNVRVTVNAVALFCFPAKRPNNPNEMRAGILIRSERYLAIVLICMVLIYIGVVR